eukprot:superscaffoldBa00001822_g12171
MNKNVMKSKECVCVWGSYSVAFLTGACLAVTLLRAETEMDSYAAEGQGYSWLSLRLNKLHTVQKIVL